MNILKKTTIFCVVAIIAVLSAVAVAANLQSEYQGLISQHPGFVEEVAIGKEIISEFPNFSIEGTCGQCTVSGQTCCIQSTGSAQQYTCDGSSWGTPVSCVSGLCSRSNAVCA